jgi:hypothetical protein
MKGKRVFHIKNVNYTPKINIKNEMNSNVFNSPIYNFNFQQYSLNITPDILSNKLEHVRAVYGVSKYTSNLVSGKMFKNL